MDALACTDLLSYQHAGAPFFFAAVNWLRGLEKLCLLPLAMSDPSALALFVACLRPRCGGC